MITIRLTGKKEDLVKMVEILKVGCHLEKISKINKNRNSDMCRIYVTMKGFVEDE